ncbi:MAG: saccharopine dehydrogenase family protein [Calditrichia bacterium]
MEMKKAHTKVVVLGAGLVGKAMAIDLKQAFTVTSVDVNPIVLAELRDEYDIETIEADLSDSTAITKAVENADIVVGAVPGHMGYEMLKTVIEAGKSIVDISFFDADPFELDELAKKHDVTAIVDCGVAPGMSNLILGYYNSKMDVENFECYVGGLPVVRSWPYEYKAPFSPIDVLEEYTRPARIRENGKDVVKKALSEPEYLELENIGTLEAFNTDGLRTLLKTMDIPNMKEKTLRYPGHIYLMRVLRDSGFFNQEEIAIRGTKVRPIDLSSHLLFDKWKLGEGEEEFTVMLVSVQGKEDGKDSSYSYHLFDRNDPGTGFSSMARTTGFTCTAAVNMLAEGLYSQKGISPPEYVGAADGCFEYIIKYLEERDVHYRMS